MSAAGLKPPPRRAPRRLRSTGDLRGLQRLMTHALVRPLSPEDGLQERWLDGRPMAEVAGEFIKSNDRLTAFERLQIYGRMYWYRLIDCAYDDSPGLRAVLGDAKFDALVRAYLARHPSRSFTLRNLSSRLPRFIRENPRLTAPRTALAWDVARFEWARTVAFDGEERPRLTADDVADAPPAKLRVGLQPHLTLLDLRYPLDDFVIAVRKRDALRAEASNAVEAEGHARRKARRIPPPRPQRARIAVHRHEERVYYKRLEPAAFRILEALGEGRTVARAVAAAGPRTKPDQVSRWFSTWMRLGWLCRR